MAQEEILLDTEPFREWLAHKKVEYGSKTELARVCSIGRSVISDILSGERKFYAEHKIDRALSSEGTTQLWELYPKQLDYVPEETSCVG